MEKRNAHSPQEESFVSKTALVLVDLQNDFISEKGSLFVGNCEARQDPRDILPRVEQLRRNFTFDHVIWTLDWHPENHVSFYSNHHSSQPGQTITLPNNRKQTLWPKHCVQHSWGSEVPENYKKETDLSFKKGLETNIDSYSAFRNEALESTGFDLFLKERNVDTIFVCGLALDICVGLTVCDAADFGFKTILIDDCSKGTSEEAIKLMKQRFIEKNITVVQSEDIPVLFKRD